MRRVVTAGVVVGCMLACSGAAPHRKKEGVYPLIGQAFGVIAEVRGTVEPKPSVERKPVNNKWLLKTQVVDGVELPQAVVIEISPAGNLF